MAHVPNPIRESVISVVPKGIFFHLPSLSFVFFQQLFDQLSVFYAGGGTDA